MRSLSFVFLLALAASGCGDSGSDNSLGGGGGGGAGDTAGNGPDGAGGQLPTCELNSDHSYDSDLVNACVASDSEDFIGDFVVTLTVTAVRAASPDELCGGIPKEGAGDTDDPEVDIVIELVDTGGQPLGLGLRAPGFGVDSVSVGDVLVVESYASLDECETLTGFLRIDRDGELLAFVGAPGYSDLTFEPGGRECDFTHQLMSRTELTVTTPDGDAVVPNGSSAQIGDLVVGVDYSVEFESGWCEFEWAETTEGAFVSIVRSSAR